MSLDRLSSPGTKSTPQSIALAILHRLNGDKTIEDAQVVFQNAQQGLYGQDRITAANPAPAGRKYAVLTTVVDSQVAYTDEVTAQAFPATDMGSHFYVQGILEDVVVTNGEIIGYRYPDEVSVVDLVYDPSDPSTQLT